MEPFPVDDFSLELLNESLDFYLTYQGGELMGVGDFSLNQLLNFWSGYDIKDSIREDDDIDGIECYTHTKPIYSEHDVIRALILEIQRLRRQLHG